MKSILVLLAVLGFAAHAQEVKNTFCEKVIVCGTYQAEDNRDPMHPKTREITISSPAADKLQIEFATIDNGIRTSHVGTSNLTPDGTFTSLKAGETFVAGICRNMACTMVDAPYLDKGEIIETVAVLRFANNNLEFSKLYVDGKGQIHPSLIVFTKK